MQLQFLFQFIFYFPSVVTCFLGENFLLFKNTIIEVSVHESTSAVISLYLGHHKRSELRNRICSLLSETKWHYLENVHVKLQILIRDYFF